ncbi:MAG: two-component system cell cycle sensor histidine kinase/response regulator CckA [Planctomycetota bacterium]|jgi:two-component system cell cycle sensor histidine kinase/response regulator CckA
MRSSGLAKNLADTFGDDIEGMSKDQILEVIHSLQTHQIELELQNVELRKAQDDLASAHERMSYLYDLAPIGYITLDSKNRITEANLTAARFLGVVRGSLIGQSFSDYILPEYQDAYYHHRQSAVAGKSLQVCELRLQKCDGKSFWVAMEFGSVNSDDEETMEMRVTIADITDLHRALEEAEVAANEKRSFDLKIQQSQKLESLGVMAGGIAHDFNNILTVILGNLFLMKLYLTTDSDCHRYADEITIATKRAEELTSQMLAYSGKGNLVIVPLDLSSMVEEMAHLLSVSHSKKSHLVYQFEPALPQMEGDATQIRQIIMNLITNASDAIGDLDGTITLKTGSSDLTSSFFQTTTSQEQLPNGSYVFLEVSDTGCGMDAQTLQRMFDPFFTTKFTGRGLGMAAVMGIIGAHRGAIKIDSVIGQGTQIRVVFPALNYSVDVPTREVEPISQWVGKGSVLVVDDEEANRIVLKHLLVRKGFRVLVAKDGREALDVFQREPAEIVCVLLDLTMPRMDGLETFAELRKMQESVAVILISGYSENRIPGGAERLGFAGFLKKPINSHEMYQSLRSILAH